MPREMYWIANAVTFMDLEELESVDDRRAESPEEVLSALEDLDTEDSSLTEQFKNDNYYTNHKKDNTMNQIKDAISTVLGTTNLGVSNTETHDPHTFSVKGEDIFDVLPDLSSLGQRKAYKGISNGWVYRAVTQANRVLVAEELGRNTPEEQARLLHDVQLYSLIARYAADECFTLAVDPEFDYAMTPEEMMALQVSSDPKAYEAPKAKATFERKLALVGKSPAEIEVLRNARAQKALTQAHKYHKEMVDREAEIIDMVRESYGEVTDVSDSVGDFHARISEQQHAQLFDKVLSDLKKAQDNALKYDYDGSETDLLMLTDDIKRVDAASMAFRRSNRVALITTQQLREEAHDE